MMRLDLKSFLVGAIVIIATLCLLGTFIAGMITRDFDKFYEMANQIIVSALIGGAIANILVSQHRAPPDPNVITTETKTTVPAATATTPDTMNVSADTVNVTKEPKQ